MTPAQRDRAQWLLDEIVWEAFTRSGGAVDVMVLLLTRRIELETLLDAEVRREAEQ